MAHNYNDVVINGKYVVTISKYVNITYLLLRGHKDNYVSLTGMYLIAPKNFSQKFLSSESVLQSIDQSGRLRHRTF